MKTTVLLAGFVLATLPSFAQHNGLIVFGGPQGSSTDYRISGQRQQATPRAGFNIGTGLKVPFENHLYFAPSLAYSMKGYDVRFSRPSNPPSDAATSNRTRIHTAEMRVLLQYDLSLKASHFYVKTGPVLDFQLKGHETFAEGKEVTVSRPMTFDFNAYGYVGANVFMQFGYETRNGLSFAAEYSHGIGSINNVDNGPIILHRVYGLTVGYYLKQAKR